MGRASVFGNPEIPVGLKMDISTNGKGSKNGVLYALFPIQGEAQVEAGSKLKQCGSPKF